MNYATEFKKGEIVRSKSGFRTLKVHYTGGRHVYGYYTHNGESAKLVKYNCIKVDDEVKIKSDMMTGPFKVGKFYIITKISESVKYTGSYIGRSTSGDEVFEIANTKHIVTFANADFTNGVYTYELVVPYSIEVEFRAGSGGTKAFANFWAELNEFEIGDILITDNLTLARVMAVDTKSEKATRRFSGRKLCTTQI